MQRDRALVMWREATAVEMRISGMSYDEIARQLGYHSKGSAWKAVNRSLERRVAADIDEHWTQLFADMYTLQEAIWATACRGNNRAFAKMIRIFDMRARLLGYKQAQEEYLLQ